MSKMGRILAWVGVFGYCGCSGCFECFGYSWLGSGKGQLTLNGRIYKNFEFCQFSKKGSVAIVSASGPRKYTHSHSTCCNASLRNWSSWPRESHWVVDTRKDVKNYATFLTVSFVHSPEVVRPIPYPTIYVCIVCVCARMLEYANHTRNDLTTFVRRSFGEFALIN